ncbi:hypothetical protein HPB48_003696 [Haemaphysalis longicornis]|uniref:Uncharacterized protein n=1 Tax=Haemaphysalis longicornis TaxID=44386 RepID=A0A9J6FGN3_HAELO|nr:hypothetical protein HPB48_003696 [Haemaphysalis longicornis]
MGCEDSPDGWKAASSQHGPIPSKFSKAATLGMAHNCSVMNKSSITHTTVYTDIAETLLPPRNDTGEEDERVPVHVCVVPWVDTAHCVANAGEDAGG